MTNNTAIIHLSLGDPCGIGTEVSAKAVQTLFKENYACIVHLYGHAQSLGFIQNTIAPEYSRFIHTHPLTSKTDHFHPGKADVSSGKVALESLKRASENCLKIGGVLVTAPLSKQHVALSYPGFVGHTDYLADLFSIKNYAMAFAGKDFDLLLQTVHLPLSSVSEQITADRVLDKIRLAARFAKMRGKSAPIYVLGLNPHAGEDGLLGSEEKEIKKAIAQASSENLAVEGPLPGDSAFARIMKNPEACSVVLAMFHDQGLGPLKMNSMGQAVNITLGLPILRLSVDHGTAFDIAGKDCADPGSMLNALKTGMDLYEQEF